MSARKDVATTGFNRLADLESEMDEAEKLRLLYVACTRARDYLFVSANHVEDGRAVTFARMAWEATADAPTACWRVGEQPIATAGKSASSTTAATFDPEARRVWIERRAALLEEATRPRVISATGLRRVAGEAGRLVLQPESGRTQAEADLEADCTWRDDPWRRGRAATAFGRAVHAAMQDADLDEPSGLAGLAVAAARAEGIFDQANEVTAAARVLWEAPVVRAAAMVAARREAYVAAPIGSMTVEGYVDLLIPSPEGLVIVDYKTDAVEGPAAIEARAEEYRPQLAAYTLALERSTGLSVAAGVLVFATPTGPVEHRVARDALELDRIEALLATL